MLTAHKGAMYELTGIMENVDADLERARISASADQQSRILTDLLVQARLAELDLEKLPITAECDCNATTFVNRIARECERMLAKLRRGEKLSEEDYATLESLYAATHSIRMDLDTFLADFSDGDLSDYMKKGSGKMADLLDKI